MDDPPFLISQERDPMRSKCHPGVMQISSEALCLNSLEFVVFALDKDHAMC